MNDLAVDLAGYVDREHKAGLFKSREAWAKAWVSPARGFVPKFVAAGAKLPEFFIGRLLVRVCEHMWPGLFAGLSPRDDTFVRRSARLLALANAYADLNTSDEGKRMVDELLESLDPGGLTSLGVRRQLCQFFAWVEEARREWAEQPACVVDVEEAEALRETATNRVETGLERFEPKESEPAQAFSAVPMSASLEAAMPGPRPRPAASREAVRDGRSVPVARGDATRGGAPAPAAPKREAARRGPSASPAKKAELTRSGRAKSMPRAKAVESIELRAEPASDQAAMELLDEVHAELMAAVAEGGRITSHELWAELLMKLEILITRPGSPKLEQVISTLIKVIHIKTGDFAEHCATLTSLAQLAAEHKHDEWAFAFFQACWIVAYALELDDELVHCGALYLPFVLNSDPESRPRVQATTIADRLLEELRPVLDKVNSRRKSFRELELSIWMVAAELRANPPNPTHSWPAHYDNYKNQLRKLYTNDAGRENTRRYVLLLRAEGADDPGLDHLLGPRATLISASRGDPDIIQAYADILMTRRDDEAYAIARKLYLRLQGKPQWTPQVMHNLATAINALEPHNRDVGALWLDAHRLAPGDLLIRRALSRFLRGLGGRGNEALALAVSRGETVNDDFNPFDATAILDPKEDTP